MAGVLGGLIGSLAKLNEITHVGFSSGLLDSGVAYPSGLQVGDVIFMLISSDNSEITGSNSTLASSNGFTTLNDYKSSVEGLVAYRVLTSVPSGTITGIKSLPVVLTAFRGVDTLLPIVSSLVGPDGDGGMPDPPAISASTNQMLLAIGFLDDDAIPAVNVIPPTGYTNAGSFSSSNDISTVMSAYKKITTNGLENPGQFTENWAGVGDDVHHSVSVVLRPVGEKLGVAGYFLGGFTGSANRNGIDKLSYVDESRLTLSVTLSSLRRDGTGFANSGTAGYAAGGFDGVLLSSINKIIFANDSRSILSATMTSAVFGSTSFSNHGTAGYIAAGVNGGYKTTIDKITYSNDAKSTLSATVTNGTKNSFAFSNTGTAGYVLGGQADPTWYSTIDKVAYSNESKSTLGISLAAGISAGASIENWQVSGFRVGGHNSSGTRQNSIEKLVFATETLSTISSPFASPWAYGAGASNRNVSGYFAGGVNDSGIINSIQKLVYSTDTRSTISATLGGISYFNYAFGNSGAV